MEWENEGQPMTLSMLLQTQKTKAKEASRRLIRWLDCTFQSLSIAS